jgi:hypothetical protein
MTVLRRALRTFRPVYETLLAGVLVGVVAMGFASQIAGGSSATGEVPLARSYMLALIHNDIDTMSQLGPSADTLGQAINFQKRADALKNLKVDSLTYLGGSALGAAGVHVYVVATEDQGGEHLIPFSLTVFQGRVVRVE